MKEAIKKYLEETMIRVEGGEFMMGSEDVYGGTPIHKVELNSFWINKYPITQELYEWVMGNNPSWFQGKNRPVEQVSWDDAKVFIEKLNNQSEKLKYRLPSESEWEYAARGGKEWEKGFQYSGGNDLRKVGWYEENSHHETQDVGLKMPNQLGLYDMSGNVWEWCEDGWHDSYEGAPNDGTAWKDNPERDDDRVLRGGCWSSYADNCRVANRISYYLVNGGRFLGFRLAAALP